MESGLGVGLKPAIRKRLSARTFQRRDQKVTIEERGGPLKSVNGIAAAIFLDKGKRAALTVRGGKCPLRTFAKLLD